MEEVVDKLIVVGRSDLEQSVMQHVAIPEMDGTRHVRNGRITMELLQASRVLVDQVGFDINFSVPQYCPLPNSYHYQPK